MRERLFSTPPTITVETAQGPVEGLFFWRLSPDKAGEFPGSYLGPEDFLATINFPEKEQRQTGPRLLFHQGNHDFPILAHERDELHLRVLESSATTAPLVIMALAKTGFDNPKDRATYQATLSPIYQEIFHLPSTQKPDLHIIEDCLATGETIVALIHLLREETTVPARRIRVDVAAATTMGISYLSQEAIKNNWELELNTGWLAYGLSAGNKQPDGTRTHANYITLPPEIISQLPAHIAQYAEKQIGGDGNVYVVGDMGDAGLILPPEYNQRYTWNNLRAEQNEPRVFERDRDLSSRLLDPSRTIRVFLANGGYLTRAYWLDYLASRNLPDPGNELITQAKRIWSPERGCGVLVGHLPKTVAPQPESSYN